MAISSLMNSQSTNSILFCFLKKGCACSIASCWNSLENCTHPILFVHIIFYPAREIHAKACFCVSVAPRSIMANIYKKASWEGVPLGSYKSSQISVTSAKWSPFLHWGDVNKTFKESTVILMKEISGPVFPLS